MQVCEVHHAGCIAYDEAWGWQKRLARARGAEQCPDHLLLLEHPHTYTLGSATKMAHLLMGEAERSERGVNIYDVDRGGGITYHGPGQLVGYPIMRLGGDHLRTNVVDYVRRLEQVLVEALADFGVEGYRLPGYTGVWVDSEPRKIAAIGVKVTVHRVTYHGFALNVNTDLSYFDGIVPCGIADKPMTSMQDYLDQYIDMGAVITAVMQAFGAVFQREIKVIRRENGERV